MSTDYDFRKDSMLKNRIALEWDNSSYVHRSHEANFFWCADKGKIPDDTETFLLMPAGKTDGVIWYYFFIADTKVDPCWTIGVKKGDKLGTHPFTGNSSQEFAFEDAGGGKVYIQNKGSGLYLYRGRLMDAHHAVRQAPKKDSDKFKFQIKKLSQVVMPATANPDDHPKPLDIGNPPYPQEYGDIPLNPDKVLVGETLIPFYMVGSDSACVGPNLRSWQINNRPYYRLRREQQWQSDPSGIINQPDIGDRTDTITETYGIREQSGKEMQDKTSFTVGVDIGSKAEMGVSLDGITAKTETTRAFKMQWQHEVTVTTTESTEIWTTYEHKVTIEYKVVEGGFTYINWVLTDIWTLLSGEDQNGSWNVLTTLNTPTTFPRSVSVNEAPVE